jgi:hypothetical protein
LEENDTSGVRGDIELDDGGVFVAQRVVGVGVDDFGGAVEGGVFQAVHCQASRIVFVFDFFVAFVFLFFYVEFAFFQHGNYVAIHQVCDFDSFAQIGLGVVFVENIPEAVVVVVVEFYDSKRRIFAFVCEIVAIFFVVVCELLDDFVYEVIDGVSFVVVGEFDFKVKEAGVDSDIDGEFVEFRRDESRSHIEFFFFFREGYGDVIASGLHVFAFDEKLVLSTGIAADVFEFVFVLSEDVDLHEGILEFF